MVYLGPRVFPKSPIAWSSTAAAYDPSSTRAALAAINLYQPDVLLVASVLDDDPEWPLNDTSAPSSQQWGTYPESAPWTTGLIADDIVFRGSKLHVVGAENGKGLSLVFDAAAGAPNGASLRPTATTIAGMREAQAIVASKDMIWVAGVATKSAVARLASDGSVDTAFGNAGVLEIGEDVSENGTGIGTDAMNRVYVAYASPAATKVARLTPTGDVDTTFGTGGRVTTGVLSPAGGHLYIVVESGGAVWVPGLLAASDGGAPIQSAIVRITPDGALDPVIGAGGIGALPPFSNEGTTLRPQPDSVFLRASPDIGRCGGQLYVDVVGKPSQGSVLWLVLP